MKLFFGGCVALIVASMMSGCVPSPDASEDNLPTFSILSDFFTREVSSTVNVWQDSNAATNTNSLTNVVFDHNGSNIYSSVYPTASYFLSTDSLTKKTSTNTYVIEDSVVIEYVRIDTATVNEVVRLRGLLAVANSWVASSGFKTSNGAIIKISALIDNYYAQSVAGGVQYSDVFHITYTISDVLTTTQPSEPEYQRGAALGVYYAKGIGPTYMIAKDASGATLWVDQLVETHTR